MSGNFGFSVLSLLFMNENVLLNLLMIMLLIKINKSIAVITHFIVWACYNDITYNNHLLLH